MFLQRFKNLENLSTKNVKSCSKLLTFEHVFYRVLNMRKFSENFVIFKSLKNNKYANYSDFKIEKRCKSFVSF